MPLPVTLTKIPSFEDLLKKFRQPKVPPVVSGAVTPLETVGAVPPGLTLPAGWKVQPDPVKGLSFVSPRGNTFTNIKVGPEGKIADLSGALANGRPVKIPPLPPPEPIAPVSAAVTPQLSPEAAGKVSERFQRERLLASPVGQADIEKFATALSKESIDKLPSLTWLDKAREVGEDPAKLLPFVSGAKELYQIGELLRTANDLEAGNEVSQGRLRDLQAYIVKSQQDTDFGYKVANVVAGLLPFAGELVATGGIFTAGKVATVKAGELALKKLATRTGLKFVEGKLAQFGVKAAGVVAGGTLQTIPAGMTRIPVATIEKQLQGTLTGDEEEVWRSLVNSVGGQWVEVVSERTGGALALLGAPIKGQMVKMGLLRAIQKANPGRNVNDLRNILDKMGYHGILGEMFEERVADVGHGVLASLGLGNQEFKLPSMEQLGVELVAFSIPAAGMKALELPSMARGAIDTFAGGLPLGQQAGVAARKAPTPQSGDQIAKVLGIKFDGIQKGTANIPDKMKFTDPVTGSPTYGNSLEEVKANIATMRAKFEGVIPAPEVAKPNLIQQEADRLAEIQKSPEYKKLQAEWQDAREKYGLHAKETLALRDKLLSLTTPARIVKVPLEPAIAAIPKAEPEKVTKARPEVKLGKPPAEYVAKPLEEQEPIKTWLSQGWGVVVAPDKSRIPQLQKEGYEPSQTLLGVWIRKRAIPKAEPLFGETEVLPLFTKEVTGGIIEQGRQADLAIRLGWLNKEGQLTKLGELMLDEPLSNLGSNIRPLAIELRKAVAKIPKLGIPRAEPAPEVGMAPSTSVQVGLPGIGKEAAQVQMFGEVSGKESRKTPLVEVPKKGAEPLPGQTEAFREAEAQSQEIAERAAIEAEAKREMLRADPVAGYRFKMAGRNVGLDSLISIKEQTFPEYLTVKQAQALNPEKSFVKYTVKGTKFYNKVPKDAALDQLSKEFNMTPDEIADRVMEIRAEKRAIRQAPEQQVEVYQQAIDEGVPPDQLPPEPPQAIIPPEPMSFPEMPADSEIKRIIAQAEEQIRQNAPTALTKLALKIPGIKQLIEFERPGLKMTGDKQRVLTALVAENAARSDVSVWAMATRLQLLGRLRKTFGKDVLRGAKSDIEFTGTEEQSKNPITGTLKDIADNPELYALTDNQLAMLVEINIHNDTLLFHVVENYGAEIGKFTPKENGAFLPNVDISEDVVEFLGSETRAVAQGRGKTRVWATARDRMGGKTPFKPELDVQKLIEGLDTFKSSAAGGQTYKAAIGGLTKSEVIKETHPDLYKKMESLRKELNSLRGSAGTIEGNIHTAIDDFLHSPAEDNDLLTLRTDLDVRLKAGKRKGLDMSAIQDRITAVQDQIDALRPAWQSTNLKPYTFVQEGIFRYFPGDTAKTIIESRAVTKNRLLSFIEKWRGQAFSGDLSPFAIQGSIGVLADPIGSLKAAGGGIIKAIEAKDILRSVKIEALADDISNNAQEWGQFASLMGRGLSGTPREYSAGFLSMIPGFDKFTENTYVSVTRGSFNLWQRLYKQMMKAGVPELEAKIAAIKSASEIYPMVNASLLGQSQARESVLRALPTSYSFIRQPVTLIADGTRGFAKFAARKKLTPQESSALKLLITMAASTLAVAATSAAITAKAKGGDDDDVRKAIWDAVNPDPYNGKFASIIVGNVRIPIGGPYRAIFRAVYPSEVKGIPFPVPFAGIGHFLKNRITPAVRTQLDLIINKDYAGTPIIKGDFPENILRGLEYEFENFVPLTLGTVAESIRRGDKYREPLWQQVIGQFMGVNPVTLDNTYIDRQLKQLGQPKQSDNPYEKQQVYDVRDVWGDVTSVLKKRTGKGYDDKPQTQAILESMPIKEVTDGLLNDKLTGVDMDKLKFRMSIINDKVELAAFDKDNLSLVNISKADYTLLQQYKSLSGAKQEAFLAAHPGLSLSPRKEWLKSHPDENAELAIWGLVKPMTVEAYDKAWAMVADLKIPESAVMEYLTDTPTYLGDTLRPEQLKDWSRSRIGESVLLTDYDKTVLSKSDTFKNQYRVEHPDIDAALVLAGRSTVVSNLESASFIASEARKYNIPLNQIPAFSLTDKGKERIPSDRNLWQAFFDYNDLPGTSYLAMTQEQVDAGMLPEKYLTEWETYRKLKSDTAKDYFRKYHKEVSRGDWRDDFRRANTDFNKWAIESSNMGQNGEGLKPLQPKKTALRRWGITVARAAAIGGGMGISVARPRRGKPSYPKFKKISVKSGMKIGAPGAPRI